MNQDDLVRQFLSQFYDVCSTTDSFNVTLDEFYEQFPKEMHDFLIKYAKITQKEVQNG